MKPAYTKDDLREAARTLASLLMKLRKAQRSLARGSPQHTLAKNRIKALRIAQALVKAKLGGGPPRRPHRPTA